jgi:hypothetical protein
VYLAVALKTFLLLIYFIKKVVYFVLTMRSEKVTMQ